ncbi:hypothetical protein [Pantoea endophytica]
MISNGLDFLNKAREELEAGQAKLSKVSFWMDVEILMKVPLVPEHWTLACSGKRWSIAGTWPATSSHSPMQRHVPG